MKAPTLKGQTYTIKGMKRLLTVKGFGGESGILYDTLEEAIQKSSNKYRVLTYNEEYGGGTTSDKCILNSIN